MSHCTSYAFFATDFDGNALAGGLVYSYNPGTELAKATYSDYDLTTENANPVVLDASGMADIHAGTPTKLVIKSASGQLIDVVEDISGLITTVSGLVCSSVTTGTDCTIGDTLTVGWNLIVAGDMDINPDAAVNFQDVTLSGSSIGGTATFTSGSLFANTITISHSMVASNSILFFGSMTAADAANNTLFLDAADSQIKLRDNVGDFKGIYTP